MYRSGGKDQRTTMRRIATGPTSAATGLGPVSSTSTKQIYLYLGTNWMQDLKQLDWRYSVAKIVKKSFDAPEEIRSLHRGKIEVVDLGGVEIRRVTHEPGWRWSECVKPDVGTDSCQVGHLIHVLSGRI